MHESEVGTTRTEEASTIGKYGALSSVTVTELGDVGTKGAHAGMFIIQTRRLTLTLTSTSYNNTKCKQLFLHDCGKVVNGAAVVRQVSHTRGFASLTR